MSNGGVNWFSTGSQNDEQSMFSFPSPGKESQHWTMKHLDKLSKMRPTTAKVGSSKPLGKDLFAN